MGLSYCQQKFSQVGLSNLTSYQHCIYASQNFLREHFFDCLETLLNSVIRGECEIRGKRAKGSDMSKWLRAIVDRNDLVALSFMVNTFRGH